MKGIGFYNNDFLVIKSDKNLIIESIKRIFFTLPGERVGNLDFGSNLRNYLFDFDNVLLEDLEQDITSAIIRWEPRVTIQSITVSQDLLLREKINVLIIVSMKTTSEILSIPINLNNLGEEFKVVGKKYMKNFVSKIENCSTYSSQEGSKNNE